MISSWSLPNTLTASHDTRHVYDHICYHLPNVLLDVYTHCFHCQYLHYMIVEFSEGKEELLSDQSLFKSNQDVVKCRSI
jgi:phenylpropionate dioxygenase-like ring-hydroxylating dioxygenase large terminal subunit